MRLCIIFKNDNKLDYASEGSAVLLLINISSNRATSNIDVNYKHL